MALKGRRSTSEERLRAVQLLKEGNEAATIARMFNVSRAILFRWQQKYDQGGPVALETKKTPGPTSRLSPTQLSKLYAIITGSDPRQVQFDFGLWTRKIIRELIRREFGVKLSEVQVGRLLKKMGLSPQRPLYRAYQQDPERVAEWKKSVYPKIRKLAAEEGASIFFADEASIRTDHHAGTTWAPAGQTPVVITTGERKSVNMVSAISPRGELRFRIQEGKMNAGKFIDFLKALLDSVPGKIFLIVDGHPVHKAKKVSEFVKEKADGRLSIFFLPPYSPDLNPDEWVWNNVKNDRIGRGVIMSADDLKAKAIGALRRLQKLPDIVRGFLRDPKLAYILELHKRTAREVYKLIFSLVCAAGCPQPSTRPDRRVSAPLSRGTFAMSVARRAPVSSTCGRPVCIFMHRSPERRMRASAAFRASAWSVGLAGVVAAGGSGRAGVSARCSASGGRYRPAMCQARSAA